MIDDPGTALDEARAEVERLRAEVAALRSDAMTLADAGYYPEYDMTHTVCDECERSATHPLDLSHDKGCLVHAAALRIRARAETRKDTTDDR